MKQIRILASITLLTLLFLQNNAKAETGSYKEELADFFDGKMLEIIDRYNLPNASIAVVAGGEIIFLKGYGFADLETLEPVKPGFHLFRPGSISKVFTWTAIMQLAEKGLVDLDADINTYLDFEIPPGLYAASSDEPVQPITLKHLMTHSAGFEDILGNLFSLDPDKHPELGQYLTEKIPARIFPPGKIMAYSNYGSALAGYIIERISGKSFEQHMNEHIFQPLGMQSSSFEQPLPQNLYLQLVNAYRQVDGEFLPGRFEYMPAPAGGLSTTASDMALFMMAHLNGGRIGEKSILQPETTHRMHTKLFAQHFLLGGMAHGFKETVFNGQQVVFHGGSTTLFDSGLYLIPDSGIGIFISYSGGSFMAHTEIFHAFMDTMAPPPGLFLPVFPHEQALRQAKELQGEYQQSRRAESSSDKLLNIINGVMRVKADKDGTLMVTHLGKTHRFSEEEPGVYRNLEREPSNPFGTFDYLVAGKDPRGRTMLMSDGPMTYIRMPWYARGGFTIALLLGSLLISLGIVLNRFARWIVGKIKKSGERPEKRIEVARWISMLHAAIFILMVVLLAVTGMPDPVYLLPLSAFGEYTSANTLLGILPYLLALLGPLLLLLAVSPPLQKAWKNRTRILIGVQAIFAAGLIWFFWFYHMFSW